jgi:hypothetical protein
LPANVVAPLAPVEKAGRGIKRSNHPLCNGQPDDEAERQQNARLDTHFMRVDIKIKRSHVLFMKIGYDLSKSPPHYFLPHLSKTLNSRTAPPSAYCSSGGVQYRSRQES